MGDGFVSTIIVHSFPIVSPWVYAFVSVVPAEYHLISDSSISKYPYEVEPYFLPIVIFPRSVIFAFTTILYRPLTELFGKTMFPERSPLAINPPLHLLMDCVLPNYISSISNTISWEINDAFPLYSAETYSMYSVGVLV